jgi:alpha-L-fucosidase 2
MLAKACLTLPAHTASAIGDYRRTLDLSNGLVTATYTLGAVAYRREVLASHPDDVVVVRLSQSGGGSYTGSMTFTGTRQEAVTADASADEVAAAAVYLARPAAACVTGTALAVDGGMQGLRLRPKGQ